MRFHMPDTRRHRRVTKSLLKALRDAGLDTGHTAVADLAARLYGYADRNELDACVGRGPASLFDEDEAPGIVAARRERQAAVLVSAGVSRDRVGDVLAATWPTARSAAGAAPRPVVPKDPAVTTEAVAARPRDSIDTLLDEWDRDLGGSPAENFARLVNGVYEGAFEWIEVTLRADGSEVVVARTADDRVQMQAHPTTHLTGWVTAQMRHNLGKTLVAHPEGWIGVTLNAIRIGGDSTLIGYLDRTKAIPARPVTHHVGKIGEAWVDAVCNRTGIHVICGVGSNVVKSLMREARARRPHVLGIMDESEAVGLDQSGPRLDRTPNEVLRNPAIQPRRIVFVRRDESYPLSILFGSVLRSEQSYVYLMADGKPDDLIKAALLSGVPSEHLRQLVISTTVWDGFDEKWVTNLRHRVEGVRNL